MRVYTVGLTKASVDINCGKIRKTVMHRQIQGLKAVGVLKLPECTRYSAEKVVKCLRILNSKHRNQR